MQKSLYNTVYAKVPDESQLIYTDESASELPSEKIRRLHYHSRTEIGICRKGNGLWLLENRSYAMSPGDVIIVPKGVPHYSRTVLSDSSSPCMCDFIYFDEEKLLRECGIDTDICTQNESLDFPAVLNKREHSQLRFLLEQMINTVRCELDSETKFKISAHFYSIFLLERRKQFTKREVTLEAHDSRLIPAVQRIVVDFSENLTLADLASECSVSASHFLKLFKEQYGASPIKYLNNFRVEIASRLLAQSESSITEICSFVGFSTPSELYRHFQNRYGMSPTKYRALKQRK